MLKVQLLSKLLGGDFMFSNEKIKFVLTIGIVRNSKRKNCKNQLKRLSAFLEKPFV